MGEAERPVFIYATFASPDEAKEIGRELVARKLAACVNVFPPMTAVFEWEGALEEAEETAMVIKTRAGLAERVAQEVRRMHSYDTPAVVVLHVTGGSAPFLEWIARQTASPEPANQ